MHLQPVNSNTTAFGANHLRSIKIASDALNSRATKIDIYSIDKKDSDLIGKLLLKTDLKSRSDEKALQEKSTLDNTLRYVLNKALHLENNQNSGVLISVKNNKYVTGLLDYTNSGMPLIKDLMAWNKRDREVTRSNLLVGFLNNVAKNSEKSDVVAYAEPKSKGNKWLKEVGFSAPEGPKYARERVKLDADKVAEVAAEQEKSIQNLHVLDTNANEDVKLVNLII